MEVGRDYLVGSPGSIVAFRGDEDPVDVVATAKVTDKESFCLGRAYHNKTVDTCLAGSVHHFVIAIEHEAVCIMVSLVIVEGEDYVMIAFKRVFKGVFGVDFEARDGEVLMGKVRRVGYG